MLKQLPQSLQGERKALENKISMVKKKMENAGDQFQVIGHQEFAYFVIAFKNNFIPNIPVKTSESQMNFTVIYSLNVS